MGASDTRSRRSVGVAIVAASLMIAALIPALWTAPVGAAEPVSGTQFRLEGCRIPQNAGDTFHLPNIDGDWLCTPDTTGIYTTGELGKYWAELDLVPHRLTISRNATQTIEIALLADHLRGGRLGYDFISMPEATGCSVTNLATGTQAGLIGGADLTIFRAVQITITAQQNSDCVLDWYQRLGVGSAAYPGSSLQSQVAEYFPGESGLDRFGSVGQRTVSIPDVERFQELRKEMSASRGATYVWDIDKSTSETELDFGDTCASDASLSDTFTTTIEWTRQESLGDIDVLTDVYATNTAHRTLEISVVDETYAGALPHVNGSPSLLHLDTGGYVSFPADGTEDHLIDDHSSIVSSATTLHDIATATYRDPVVGDVISVTVTATDEDVVDVSGTTNASARIADVESIVSDPDEHFSFKVTGITGTGTPGTFTLPDDGDADTDPEPYSLNTSTRGPLTWTSAEVSAGGSVVISKTVTLDEPAEESASIDDTATVTPVGASAAADSDSASVDLTADATVVLTIDKTIPDILQGDEEVSFTFKVYTDKTDVTTLVHTEVITFAAGETNKTADIDLDPGTYDLVEESPTGWVPQDDVDDIDLTLPTCEDTVVVVNSFGPATAKALKVTDPEGSENGWVMCLEGPGTEDLNTGTADEGKECVTTASGDHDGDPLTADVDGVAPFTTVLEEGDYDITEKQLTDDGWILSGSTGDCSFTVDYPDDFDAVFVCTFTNSENATVKVIKTTSGELAGAGDYTFQIREGADELNEGTILDTDTTDANGEVDFDGLPADGLEPGTYQLCETGLEVGWSNNLVDSDEGAGGPDVFTPGEDIPGGTPDNSIVCIDIVLSVGEDLVVNVDNTPPPGGDARTIGYWKNWNTCSGGNQTDSLGPALGDGILVGLLDVDTCQEAVSILNKSSLDGTKRASDPAYNLAAQYLAAELNVSPTNPLGGAGSCAAADDAMDDAQALLVAVEFDGTRVHAVATGKAKKGGTSYAMTAAEAAEANTLAGILDLYNNNELCP